LVNLIKANAVVLSDHMVHETKISRERIAELRRLAVPIIQGRASLVPDYSLKPLPRIPLTGKYAEQKIQAIITKLQNTQKTGKEIAAEEKVPFGVVTDISAWLFRQTGKKHVIKRLTRDPARKTGHFTAEQIEQIIAQKERLIENRSRALWQNPHIRTAMPSREAVADFIRDLLKWKLETFNPARYKKKVKNIIDNYCNFAVKSACLDIIKKSKRKPRTVSIDSGRVEEKGTAGNIAAKGTGEMNLRQVLKFLQEKGLTQKQQALVLARFAGINERRTGKMLGVSESRITQLWRPIKAALGQHTMKPLQSRRRIR